MSETSFRQKRARATTSERARPPTSKSKKYLKYTLTHFAEQRAKTNTNHIYVNLTITSPSLQQPVGVLRAPLGHRLVVVAQVEFERHILKPGLILQREGLKPVAFSSYGSTEFNVRRPTL